MVLIKEEKNVLEHSADQEMVTWGEGEEGWKKL